MRQQLLPMIPKGTTVICGLVSVYRDEKNWTYFLGTLPVFTHKADDRPMFRFITAQLINSGACRQVDIIKTFGIPKRSVIRWSKRLRERGLKGFFERRRGKRGGTVLTPEVLVQAQSLLDQGHTRREVSEEINVRPDTLRKAVNDGRLQETKHIAKAVTKSARNVTDADAAYGMGTACTRVEQRVLASVGDCNGAPVQFDTCLDVPKGGVLCALPALLLNGLLDGADRLLGKIKGYYTALNILLLLAFMALCRIRTMEQLRGHAPGEFGKLLGLDRIPEVRCLRNKLDDLCAGNGAELWAAHLSRYWMEANPDTIGTLYIDGHVRVYHGRLTKPPRRYVSRERLCLRGTTDYWVNDAVGRPFFLVEKAIDPGLLDTLKHNIVPRLLKDIPNQPTNQHLTNNPWCCRFILVFDREGYSPAFFRQMWRKHRIACMTYHKYPGKAWPEKWFAEHEVIMPSGERIKMKLAEMGSLVGSGNNAMWMREIRKLTKSGHQTSLISTAFDLPHTQLAGRMFSRWCQENFFNYMMQHFGIDLIIEYGVQEFPGTEKVVNPTWREMDRERNSLISKLRYRQARFAEMTMHPEIEGKTIKYRKWLQKKAALFEDIEQREHQLEKLKEKIKQTKKHITWSELDEQDKFLKLLPGRRRLIDTISMIAYRAETAMVGLLTGPTVDSSDARRLLQDLFVTEADILPYPENSILRVRVHSASRPAANRALSEIMNQLTAAEIKYPGTDMKIVYEIGGDGVHKTATRTPATRTI